MRVRALLSFLLIPVASAALYACGGGEETEQHEEHGSVPAEYADILMLGGVTDEALIELASVLGQGAPADVPTQAPTLDKPAEAEALPSTSPPVFTWHVGASASLAPQAAPEPVRLAGLLPSPAPREPAFTSPLRELFGPMRSAHAHGTPFTGTGTLLAFSVDSNPKLARVLTGDTSYVPSADVWEKLKAAGKPITLTLTSAIFEQNRVIQDGGPFAGSETTFTIAP